MVQPDSSYISVRHGLIAMLPRLKRFASVLAGTRKEGTVLLSRALKRMLSEQHRFRRGTPLDRWAFAEIYQLWLDDLRRQPLPMEQGRADEERSQGLFRVAEDGSFDAFAAAFLEGQPPQQRCALLLIHGEGFDYEDAACVLDTTPDAVATRLVRASTAFANRLSPRSETALSATIAPLFPQGTNP